jgi:glycerophosphoryl diester phosphodiesterase
MQLYAHRGASGHFPENTLLAFEQALACSPDGIELDVFCVDHELVVIHDHELHRTTNGQGYIHSFNLGELQQLDAGQGQCIPLLRDVMALVQGQCMLNIELKGEDTLPPLLALLSELSQSGYPMDTLLVSSFNHHLLQGLHQRWPTIKIGALTATLPLDYAAFASKLHAWSVHCDRSFINQAMVDDAHQRGLKVFVYTINNAAELQRMKKLGVDAVFTNWPCEAKHWLASD